MAKLLIIPLVALLAVTVDARSPAIREVFLYQEPVCSGHHYAMTVGNGECKRIPEWLTAEGWNLSIDPRGLCVKVYDNPSCRESIQPVGYGLRFDSNTREDIVRRCRSTKELGFNTIRSFKSVKC